MSITAPTTISPAPSSRHADLRVVGPRRRTVVLMAIAVTVLVVAGLLTARLWASRAGQADQTGRTVSAPATLGEDAAESAHGTAGSLRTGTGLALTAAVPILVADLDEVAHGTAGSVRTGSGRAASLAHGSPASAVVDDRAEMVHGTAGSLVSGAGSALR